MGTFNSVNIYSNLDNEVRHEERGAASAMKKSSKIFSVVEVGREPPFFKLGGGRRLSPPSTLENR
jgi:hypothetical protein